MDVSFFKNRGKAWMGDICQKVEGMLQDVDGVIKQDRKNPTADRGKTSKISVDGFFSEVIQGLHMVNPSTPNKKSTSTVKSTAKFEDKPFFINTDQSRLGPTITPKDNLGDELKSADNTVGICNLILDLEDKPKLVIYEKSELKAPIFTEKNPDHKEVSELDVVNKPCVSAESVEGEDRMSISEEQQISSGFTKEYRDMIVDESFITNKYDEVNNHFSIELVDLKEESFPFNEDRFAASVNLLEDNVKDARGSASSEGSIEDHTYQNANPVCDQLLEGNEGLLVPEPTSAETGTKSLTNHQDNAADLMCDIPHMVLSSPSSPSDSEKIPGFHSYKKNLQIQVPSDKPVDDLTEFGMETLDLHDEAAMEESSSVIDAKELYAVSQRVQKLQSFRKKIQDAFTAKRRLAKEYEQLSIWYGDIDFDGSNQHRPQNRPARSIAISDAHNQQKHQSGESEWVIL